MTPILSSSSLLEPPIGVFGGTFAPFHNGHLRLALELRERLRLACVHLIPAADPPHRERPRVAAARRLAWVKLACGEEPGLVADDRELRRPGLSYTVDTLAELRAERPTTPLVLMLGSDAAAKFETWHRWQEIPGLAHLVVVQRPDATLHLAPGLLDRVQVAPADDPGVLHTRLGGGLVVVHVPPLSISSTRIRGLLAAGRSVRGLLPQAVIDSFTAEDIDTLTHDQNPAND